LISCGANKKLVIEKKVVNIVPFVLERRKSEKNEILLAFLFKPLNRKSYEHPKASSSFDVLIKSSQGVIFAKKVLFFFPVETFLTVFIYRTPTKFLEA